MTIQSPRVETPRWLRRLALLAVIILVVGLSIGVGLATWGRLGGSVPAWLAVAPFVLGAFFLFAVIIFVLGYWVWRSVRGRR